jgi:hypothetical protein
MVIQYWSNIDMTKQLHKLHTISIMGYGGYNRKVVG